MMDCTINEYAKLRTDAEYEADCEVIYGFYPCRNCGLEISNFDECKCKENNDYPKWEKAIMNNKIIETPEKPKKMKASEIVEVPKKENNGDDFPRPNAIDKEIWEGYTDAQKLASIATYKALKSHANKHGGNK